MLNPVTTAVPFNGALKIGATWRSIGRRSRPIKHREEISPPIDGGFSGYLFVVRKGTAMIDNEFIEDGDEVWGDADRQCIVSTARRKCGREVADKIISAFGGTVIYVRLPRNITPDYELAQVAGLHEAKLIAEELGGCSIEVPSLSTAQNRADQNVIRWVKLAGLPNRKAATLVGMSDRHVRFLSAGLRAVGKLPPLAAGRRWNQYG